MTASLGVLLLDAGAVAPLRKGTFVQPRRETFTERLWTDLQFSRTDTEPTSNRNHSNRDGPGKKMTAVLREPQGSEEDRTTWVQIRAEMEHFIWGAGGGQDTTPNERIKNMFF